MAPASSASSASEGADDTVYQAKLASSLAGLPVRQGQQQQQQQPAKDTQDNGTSTKDANQLQDSLDLAVSCGPLLSPLHRLDELVSKLVVRDLTATDPLVRYLHGTTQP
jgi:hypothetical protein